MGKLTLLLVVAVGLGGTVLTLSTRGLMGDAAQRSAESQADILARQIAESAQAIALTAMIGETGFVDPGFSGPKNLQGGEYEVEIDALNTQIATFSVQGRFGGAVHTIHSTYEFDPLEFPGPIWLDVPYATVSAASGSAVTGPPNVQFDKRRHDQLRLESFLPINNMRSAVNAALSGTGSRLDVPNANAWTGAHGKLEDLNLNDAEGLYDAALAAMTADDITQSGPQTVTGPHTWGGPEGIVHVDGSLSVLSGGSVNGQGVLAIHGSLNVQAGARLNWKGIVVVKGDADVLPVTLDGNVIIEGSLVVAHQALPPGGHLDVTVNRSSSGLATPAGDVSGSPAPWSGAYPWYQHTHGFDISPTTAPRGKTVYLMEGGRAGRHEAETQFASFVAGLGSEPVYLKVANQSMHGFTRINLNINGFATPLRASARTGFGSFSSGADNFRSNDFRADELNDLVLDVRSLRALRERFDGQGGCANWPLCIGEGWNRREALTLRLMRASDNTRLYDISLYWHMRTDEVDLHAAEEAAWRTEILGGGAFGTHIRLGSNVRITMDLSNIVRLSTKLGFDGAEVRLLETSTSHLSAGQARADAAAEASPTPPATPPATPAGGPSAPGAGAGSSPPGGIPPGNHAL